MPWLPVVTPILGAVAAFMLNRGTRVRRARSAALDDLLLHERAAILLHHSQHLLDQLAAHARESVRTYDATRVAAGKKREAWIARATVVGLAVLMGIPAVALEIETTRALIALGTVGGLAGIATEALVARHRIRSALSALPVEPKSKRNLNPATDGPDEDTRPGQ